MTFHPTPPRDKAANPVLDLRITTGIVVISSLAGLVTANSRIQAADAVFSEADGSLLVESPRWAMPLDAQTGAVRTIEDRTATGDLLRGDTNLWTIQRHNEPDLEASACRFHHQWNAETWLPQWYLNEMPRWRVSANRCPAGEKHELSLVETEHGSWLSAYRLGGWGWFFRLGGRLESNDTRPQIASVIATLARLYQTPATNGAEVPVPDSLAGKPPATWPEPPGRIGVILPRPAGRPGIRLQPDPAGLLSELARRQRVADEGVEVAVFRDPAEIRQALAAPRHWFAVVNTIGEGFPAESAEQVESKLSAIREYVRNGGIWWEAGGGYSFYHALVPHRTLASSRLRRKHTPYC